MVDAINNSQSILRAQQVQGAQQARPVQTIELKAQKVSHSTAPTKTSNVTQAAKSTALASTQPQGFTPRGSIVDRLV